jgi:RHS repeat-associated protein
LLIFLSCLQKQQVFYNHAPRKIVEYPSWVTVDEDDPRVREKYIDYDANGNQLEIQEKVGEEMISLRKNLWDEENRLMAVDLKPDDKTMHPVTVYTYSTQGERVVRYNYDRIDVSSNAYKVGQESTNNIMIYPSGLVMAKVLELTTDRKKNHISYTKHYYIGAERISAKTGTCVNIGYYPQGYLATKMPDLDENLVRTSSNDKVDKAENNINYVHEKLSLNPPALNSTNDYVEESSNFNHLRNLDYFYFHPDHLGSSSYITNAAGMVSQHMEYLPFGETLVDEHTNSYNSPFKYNGKEFDEETGNYYYSSRYYDPKLSIFLSVDEHYFNYPSFSPYAYTFQNPIIHIDPDGRDGIRVVDDENKTITVKAVYYVQTEKSTYYTTKGKQKTLDGYSPKEIAKMEEKYNDYLNNLKMTVSEGEHKGYSINFDLEFKEGGTIEQSQEKAKNTMQDGYSIGNSISRGNTGTYSRFRSKTIINPDGTSVTSTVGGITVGNKDILMNVSKDTKMNRIHEIFHTFGFTHPTGGGGTGIMKYPPEKPNQRDANQLGNDSFLPKVMLKK